MTDEQPVSYEDILTYPYWRHRINLGDGRVTPGTKPATDWDRLGLPDSLHGRTFLDVGAFDGLHAFEAARRGAGRVVAVDVWTEGGREEWWYGREPRTDGFDMVRDYLAVDVERRTASVHDLDPASLGQFDVVLCSKVLPFISDPVCALERLVSLTAGNLVVESPVSSALPDDLPAMELARETTRNANRWWHPTPVGLAGVMRAVGCKDVAWEMVPSNVDAGLDSLVTRETSLVYGTPSLDDHVDDVPSNVAVTVLHRTGGACRIEYRKHPTEPYRQGWVSTGVLGRGSRAAVDNLVERGLRSVRDEGPVETAKALVRLLQSGNRKNVLARGYV